MEIQRITIQQAHLVTGLFNKYRIFYKQPSDMALAESFITQRLQHNESVIFVAIDNNLPVGFTQLYPTYSSMRVSKNWILNDLFVEATHRRQGIGEALINTAKDYAHKDGATWLALSTATDNYTAQQLYERIGFIKQIPDTAFYDYKITLKRKENV